jgi:CBS domain containing-hemolysin-like protein
MPAPEPTSLSALEILLRLGMALLLVAANGFFVAAEFALVGSRRTRIEALAETGSRSARLARDAIHHLDHYISGTQLGITLSSLALGWVGEETLSSVIIHWFDGLPAPWNAAAGHTVAAAIAFALITFMHIVLGELAPKSLALLFPERVSLWTAGPLILFSRILSPFIHLLNASANLILRAVGLRAPQEAERVHRPEELEMLITQSFEHGLLAEEPVEMLRAVFDLSETTASDVMTPRTDVVALPSTATLEAAKDTFVESGHSRLPVYEASIDHIIGVVLARDFWPAYLDRRGHSLRAILRPVPFVPESKDLEHLLHEMQRQGAHLCVVLDEYGGTAGIVSVEDVIEEIVGEIQDEHEAAPLEIEEVEPGVVRLAGRALLDDINERFGLRLPEDDYTTIAGYVTGELGRLAEVGDVIEIDGGSLQVLEMAGRRIEWLELRLSAEPPESTTPDRPTSE